MKKALAFCMAAVLLALSAGCGAAQPEAPQTQAAAVSEAAAAADIDIDLLHLSSTMVYSEVSQIMTNPEAYVGKTIRAKGPFRQNNGYYFVLISDATACCAQGIEFIWAGQHRFPDDYPDVNTEIVVTGTFDSYMEGENRYYHIDNAALETA